MIANLDDINNVKPEDDIDTYGDILVQGVRDTSPIPDSPAFTFGNVSFGFNVGDVIGGGAGAGATQPPVENRKPPKRDCK